MPGPVIAPPGFNQEARIKQLEATVQQLSQQLTGALQIPPFMRGGTPGSVLAGGKPQFDPQGLIQTLSLVAQLNAISGTTGSVNPTFATIGGASTTFTVPTGRNQNFLVFGVFQIQNTGNLSQAIYLRINLDGQLSNTLKILDAAVLGAPQVGMTTMGNTFLAALSLGGGSHTLKVEGAVDGAATCNVHDGTVNAFLYGG